MELKTKNKLVKIVISTRKIVDIAKKLGNKKFEDTFFEALRNVDLEALAKIIFILGENENGEKPFTGSDEVYDFIDEYKKEADKTYSDIYREIAEVINSEGFFNSKMKKEQLKQKITDPLSSINYEDIMKKAVEETTQEIARAEFKGYQS